MSHSSLISELKARGMIHNIMPGTEEQLTEHLTTAYVGFDPTADSLHIGHLVGVMMLRHLQRAGHKPIALLGGATGMIGDPSMKSQERNLLDMDTLRHNQECIGRQLGHFLDFESDAPNKALLLNNYDWMKDYSFLNFIRDIGKHITVNYMMAKDSVKRRLEANAEAGLSFTEFSYQLLQGYDYLHLYREYGCRVQMGGSDQWGNITTGTELIRRIDGGEAFGVTCPLIKKADGTKFGKTEQGNVWLDRRYTSPYTFCQFWLNVSDEDAERFVKIFTSIPLEEIDSLIARHRQAPHERLLQHTLAEELTVMVHGREDYEQSMSAGQILFGNNTHEQLRQMSEELLEEVMAGVPHYNVGRTLLEQADGVKLLDLLVEHAPIFKSKGELRKLIASNGISLNKEKVADQECVVTTDDLIAGKYLIVQRGKKNYYLITVSA